MKWKIPRSGAVSAPGMVLGAAVGMAVSPRQRSMKTCVGRTMQHMGNAVDNAWEDFLHAIE